MKSMLRFEGWEDSKDIPDGWLIKRTSAKHRHLLGKGGEIFDSFVEASQFIEKYRQYFSHNDVDKIEKLKKSIKPLTDKNLNDKSWTKGDPSVPKG